MTSQPIQLQPEHIKISAGTTLTVWLIRKLGRLLHIIVRSPAKLATLLPLAITWQLAHIATWLAAGFGLLCLAITAAWATQFPANYQHHIAGRARGTIRSLWVYRRLWASALKKCGVITNTADAPFLLQTNSTKTFDQLRIRMTPGQQLQDWTDKTDRLTQTFGALNCRITRITGKPRWLQLMFLTKDPLIETVDPYPPEPDALTTGLPIARTEDGKPWRLKLVGSHLLLVGATGAGKSGVLWAIIHALIPAIQAQLVRLWVMDPKGGMELGPGRQWYDRFTYGHRPTQYATVLEEAIHIMQTRQEALLGVAQLHQPSTRQPLYVVIIDEMAALTAWNTDRPAQKRIQTALALLQSQGRAVGIIVVGAIQDPRKETLPSRDLFTTRIALRLNEGDQVRMVLGPDAHNRGAKCEDIPRTMQGTAYVLVDGDPTPHRIRTAHITPAMIGAPNTELPEPEDEDVPSSLGGFA